MSRKQSESAVHPAAMASVRLQRKTDTGMLAAWSCGCHEAAPPGRFWLCDYHEGFHDAATELAKL